MSKDLLNKIKESINNETPQLVEKKEETLPVGQPDNPNPVKKLSVAPKGKPKKRVAGAQGKESTGFEELLNTLKAEKDGFTFSRRLVYIDDNIGEVLDLLRKEAKINSNVLASYLLKEFFLKHKEQIKALKEKRKDNIFFD